MEEDIPMNTEEFEKLIRSSPNSSFIWIKYMEYMLSLADTEKARCTAERALRTIDIREESEKLNIWIAYLNLENEYGNSPEEIRLGDVDLIRALFERAISLSLPPNKMKFLFNKYLEYEKFIGDENRIESVKRKALDYVSNTLA